MSWHETITANLPEPNPDEPTELRQDISDELSDHLQCAMRRELLRTDDEDAARKSVLARFGNPRAIARRLWLDAMKEQIMNQRILIGTNIVLAAVVIAMFIIVILSMRQNQQFQVALVDRLAEIAAPSAEAPEQAAQVMPASGNAAAMSWPSARIRIEGGNPPFRLRLKGEPYNPGESLTLDRTAEDGEMVFGPMRPGRYTLDVRDAYFASNSRSIVVPPGGEHEVTIEAPNWQPQPTETRVRIDLPENLGQRLGVIAVLGTGSSAGRVHVQGHGAWENQQPNMVLSADGRAGLFSNPFASNGAIGSTRTRVPGGGTGRRYTEFMYALNSDDLDLSDSITLDASLNYNLRGVSLLIPRHAEDSSGIVYQSLNFYSEEIRIESAEITSGEVRISLDLSDETIEHLRSALDELEDQCRAIGARRAGEHANMCYILHGGHVGPRVRDGFRLIVVLPGGDGSAEFRDFVRSIQENALTRNHIIAQAIAPVWDDEQAEQVVWQTQSLPWPNMEFTTEEFIAAIIDDVAEQYTLDEDHIYALGWSSGGPPVYATAMQEETKLRGAFIAMSVFHPDQYPPAENASGRSFYILHSPEDFIAMRFPEQARDTLSEAGAQVQLETYEGGHGWHGDVFGMISRGIQWLERSRR